MRTFKRPLLTLLVLPLALGACVGGPLVDGEDDRFASGKADGAIEEGSPEARAVLALVNDPAVDQAELDEEAHVNSVAATNIIATRNGPDGTVGTADDKTFNTLAELDDVSYVGQFALMELLSYATEKGYLEATAETFLDRLPGWGRYIVLDKLGRIVPVYLRETLAVLALIDALPPGTVTETTTLDEVPIVDLFVAGNVALREVLDDSDFEGGRIDHDVAWLRNSAVELEAFNVSIKEAISTGTNPPDFDRHLVYESYWHRDQSVEIIVGIRAVSRFYCNVDVRIADYEDEGFEVDSIESCD